MLATKEQLSSSNGSWLTQKAAAPLTQDPTKSFYLPAHRKFDIEIIQGYLNTGFVSGLGLKLCKKLESFRKDNTNNVERWQIINNSVVNDDKLIVILRLGFPFILYFVV
jgi:type IV secretory pathway protease TraF